MKTLLKASLLLGLSLSLLPIEPVQAGVTRISILLTGEDCAAQRQPLADQLHQIPGIVFVDGRSVPDHLLIDMEENAATAEQVVSRLNDALASKPCKAEAMKSCITADLSFNHTSPAQK